MQSKSAPEEEVIKQLVQTSPKEDAELLLDAPTHTQARPPAMGAWTQVLAYPGTLAETLGALTHRATLGTRFSVVKALRPINQGASMGCHQRLSHLPRAHFDDVKSTYHPVWSPVMC